MVRAGDGGIHLIERQPLSLMVVELSCEGRVLMGMGGLVPRARVCMCSRGWIALTHPLVDGVGWGCFSVLPSLEVLVRKRGVDVLIQLGEWLPRLPVSASASVYILGQFPRR